MKKEIIEKGTEITTNNGKLVATGFNGSIVYFDELIYNEAADVYEFERERMLTLVQVAEEMKKLDGCNHKCVWE